MNIVNRDDEPIDWMITTFGQSILISMFFDREPRIMLLGVKDERVSGNPGRVGGVRVYRDGFVSTTMANAAMTG